MSDLDFFSAVAEAIRTDSLSSLSATLQQEKEKLLCEIDAICEGNYADLVEMHEKIYDLKPTMDQVQASQEEIEASLSQLMKEHSLMVGQSQVLDSLYERVAEAEGVIQKYWETLQLLHKAELEIKKATFFCAIKTLQEAQTEYLAVPPLSSIPFSQKIHLYIHKQLKETQKRSFEAYSQWIEAVAQELTPKFGKVALNCTARLAKESNSTFAKGQLNLETDEEFEHASQEISLSILFQTLYVHTLLEERESFIKHYLKSRTSQLKQIVEVEMKERFEESLQKTAGYFIFEVFALSNSQIFYSKSLVENNWIFFLAEFYKKCQEKLAALPMNTAAESEFGAFKETIVTFTRCMALFEYRFDSLTSLFSELYIKFASVQKELFSNVITKTLDPIAVRAKFDLTSSQKDKRLTFVLRLPAQEPMFSQITSNLFVSIMEYAEKLYTFARDIPQENYEFLEMCKRNVQILITETIGNAICKLAQDSKRDIEHLKMLYHTLAVLEGAIWEEVSEWFTAKRPHQFGKRNPVSKNILSLQFTKIQQIILRDLEAKIEQLLPLEADNSDFLNYLKSIYQIKLHSLPEDARELIFWNVLSFIHSKLLNQFWESTGAKGTKFEGPDSPIFSAYISVLEEICTNFTDEFTEQSHEYIAIFSPLVQTIQCIERCAFFELTAQQTRMESYPMIDIPKFMPTLEALRISSWASKTPSPTNPKIPIKATIEDALKRLKVEFR